MKNYLKHIRFWTGFSCLFLCIACEPETFEEKERDSDPNTSIFFKKLTLEELRQQHPVMEKLEIVKTDFQKSNQKGNSISASDYGFTVNTDEITYIENGEQHSYTFLITRDNPISEVENLVLDYDKGQYNAYLVTYEATPDKLAATEGQGHRVRIVALSDFNLLLANRKRQNPCVTVIKKAVAWNELGQVTHSEWIEVIDQDCVNQSNGGGQSNSFSSSGGHGSSSGGVSNGGWGGWMGTGFNTGVYGPPQGGSHDGYTGGNTIGHSGAAGSATTDFTIGVTNPLPTINNNGNSGGHSILTKPVFNLKFGLYLKNFKNSMQTLVPNHLWWRSAEGKGIIQYLKEHFDNQTGTIDTETSEFAIWAVQYLESHPEVTWEQFENWFLGEVEGNDGDYDSEFWENPNLTFQQQQLPTYPVFFEAFPKKQNGNTIRNMPNNEVFQLVGGSMLSSHLSGNPNYKNACAIRGSRALNYSGINIGIVKHNGVQKTEKGDDLKNYILSATAFNVWMHKTFGEPTYRLSGSQVSDKTAVVSFLKGKTGLYTILNASPGIAAIRVMLT
ncbi:T6SS effector amidase Tae4 family protein [Flavobacterium cerinum]|uniref:Type VI secretion system amidase effector protein Tae4 n=1 Tax=Flavobacterium cerinum TaxID=2502784 RepID=A0ABY5IMR6_9FLAO|nr:T6SS effector amidase Tae4 family protein [Flavobacterium cerinum]UUC44049.1 type VI secretion system amidase effector protein Tae4 [Flavobacterium cerinum]